MPAGQSTQMIIGATKETDYEIVHMAQALYQQFDLKRVFYSAFVNTTGDSRLPDPKEGDRSFCVNTGCTRQIFLCGFISFERMRLLRKKPRI